SPVMRDAHNKMSKRHGDPSYEDLLAMGYLSPAVVNYVALLGWSPRGAVSEQEFFSLKELAQVFEIGGISKSPAIFDMEKLNYFNANYLRALSPDAFYAGAEPYLREAVKTPGIDLTLIAPLVQPRCDTWKDIAPQVDFFDTLPQYSSELYCHKKMKTDTENSLEALEQVLPVLEALEPWSFDGIHAALIALAQQLELKNGRIMWPLRTALSGKAVTPGGAVELCHILGKSEALRRIRLGIAQLGSPAHA
ncbi:MAG: glutamate--tRNA ligase family protein, partial [Pseudoflavonifractor sp.]